MNIWCFADGFEGLTFKDKRENLKLNHSSELVRVVYIGIDTVKSEKHW